MTPGIELVHQLCIMAPDTEIDTKKVYNNSKQWWIT